MKKLSVTFTVPILATRPTSLRPRSSSIRCSARSFGSASSSAASAASSARRLAAPARAGDRADAYLAVAHAHQDFRAGDDDLEAAEIEKAEIGRGIDAPQRAIERERRQVEAAGEALRQHDLERVAGGDIVLRPGDHREEFGLASCWRPRSSAISVGSTAGGDVVERAFERGDDRVEPRLRRLAGRARGNAGLRADRRHHDHLVAHAVEHHHHGRADQQRLGHADRVGLGRRQPLHLPHHVVAEIAEHARRHRRQARRQVDARFGEQRAQRLERLAGAGDEGVRIAARRGG